MISHYFKNLAVGARFVCADCTALAVKIDSERARVIDAARPDEYEDPVLFIPEKTLIFPTSARCLADLRAVACLKVRPFAPLSTSGHVRADSIELFRVAGETIDVSPIRDCGNTFPGAGRVYLTVRDRWVTLDEPDDDCYAMPAGEARDRARALMRTCDGFCFATRGQFGKWWRPSDLAALASAPDVRGLFVYRVLTKLAAVLPSQSVAPLPTVETVQRVPLADFARLGFAAFDGVPRAVVLASRRVLMLRPWGRVPFIGARGENASAYRVAS